MDRSFDFGSRTDGHESVEASTFRERDEGWRQPTRAPVRAAAGSGWYHDAAIEQARHDAVEARSNPYA